MQAHTEINQNTSFPFTLFDDGQFITGTLNTLNEARTFYKKNKQKYHDYLLQFHVNNEIMFQIIKK